MIEPALHNKPNGSPGRDPRDVTGGDSSTPITWLPGIVFAWAIAVVLVGLMDSRHPHDPFPFTLITIVALGTFSGYADSEILWIDSLFVTPLVAAITGVIASGGENFGFKLLGWVTVAYVPCTILWFFHRYLNPAMVLLAAFGFGTAAVVALLSGMFWLALDNGLSNPFLIVMVLIFVFLASGTLSLFSMGLGGLFRTLYEFRLPGSLGMGMPRGLIQRQFSLRSMFGVTTWFAIMFAIFGLEGITWKHCATGTKAFMIGGGTGQSHVKTPVYLA